VLRTTWPERTRPLTDEYADRIVHAALHDLQAPMR
jgi:hypothetical protein